MLWHEGFRGSPDGALPWPFSSDSSPISRSGYLPWHQPPAEYPVNAVDRPHLVRRINRLWFPPCDTAFRRGRLPRGRCRRHGHGVHRRADRPRRRARGAGRPPARRRRATGSRPTRSSGCTSPPPSTASRRRCSAAAASRSTVPRRGCTSGPTRPRSAPTTRDLLADRMVGRAGSSSSPAASTSGTARFVSRVSGERFEVPERCRIVDARYLAPDIPAETPPRFAVGDGARVIPVNDLVRLDEAPSQYVVVGSGKTATDACIWLLARGVDPDAICWVRPREPWMLNRALIQPDPADLPRHGRRHDAGGRADATSLDDLFLRLEDAGIMLRIDRSVTPTMAKAPTLGALGARAAAHHRERRTPRPHHDRRAAAGSTSSDGSVAVADDALVVNCAADGLKIPPLVPIWRPEAITAAADPGRLPVLRRRAHRLRRGDPRRRRREEPAVRAVVVRQHAGRLGEDERPGHAQRGVVQRRARHQGLGRPGRAQPGAHPARARRLGRPRRRAASACRPTEAGRGQARRAERVAAARQVGTR